MQRLQKSELLYEKIQKNGGYQTGTEKILRMV